jgi:hypothetical protein
MLLDISPLVPLASVNTGSLKRDGVLDLAVVRIIHVEIIVCAIVGDQVLGIYAATKELEGIVQTTGNLYIIDGRAVAYTVQAEAVYFVVRSDGLSAILDTNIFQHTAVVAVVRTAEALVCIVNAAFEGSVVAVYCGVTYDNDAAEVTRSLVGFS